MRALARACLPACLRRGFAGALVLAVVTAAPAAAQEATARVSGTVSAENYRALAGFLMDAFDKTVGLRVSFPVNDAYAVGKLQAYKEGELFLAYLPGPDSDSQISAPDGFEETGGGFVFDGFYRVTYGGMGQGIMSIVLAPSDAPSGAVDEIELGTLKAPAN